MNCKNCKKYEKEDGKCYGESLYGVTVSENFSCNEFEQEEYNCDIWVMPFYGIINHKRNAAFLAELEPLLKKYGLGIMVSHDPEKVKKLMDRILENLNNPEGVLL